MAYRQEISLAIAQALATTGDKTFTRPGYADMTIHAISVVVQTTLSADVAQVEVDLRPTVGSDTGRVNIAVINMAASLAAGKVVYKGDMTTMVKPGNELVVQVTDANAAGVVDVYAWTSRAYASPLNNTAMAATT